MSKSDTPLEEIDLDPAYGPAPTPKYHRDTNAAVFGWDTETADGQPFSVAVAGPNKTEVLAENVYEPVQPRELFAGLTRRKYADALNVWYNMSFDAEVALRAILDDQQLADLYATGATSGRDGRYQVKYVRGKFLSIRDVEGQYTWTHYDAMQFFYYQPLEAAAQSFLDRGKADDGLDTSKFGPGDFVTGGRRTWLNEYVVRNWFDIRTYVQQDAELVRDLFSELVRYAENQGIPFGKPYSTGYVAGMYMSEQFGGQKPNLGPPEVFNLAWKSYFGGRFEVFERGGVGRVVGPDINSAYPAVMRDLPNPGTLTWYLGDEATFDRLADAELGIVDARVTTDASRRIQPFAWKDRPGDPVIYPALENSRVQVLAPVFVWAVRNGYVTDYEILDAAAGVDHGGASYPYAWIGDLYDKRKTLKANGNMVGDLTYKLILNSLYGKTVQTTPRAEYVDRDTVEVNGREVEAYVAPDGSWRFRLPDDFPDGLNVQGAVSEQLEAGKWWNPLIATYITGMTRFELLRAVHDAGLTDDVVMFATDCIMVREDAYDASGFDQKHVMDADPLDDVKPDPSDALGKWDEDYRGDAFVIGPGIYEVDKGEDVKLKTRGFNEKALRNSYGTLSDAAAAASDDGIVIENNRPKSLGEAAWSGGDWSDVGAFGTVTRTLRPDLDRKRDWPAADTFEDLLGDKQYGNPLVR